jgi:hypothetical protein
MTIRLATAALFVCLVSTPAVAQQRPLSTEDPETVGAGRILLEGGIEFARKQPYPVSGLRGDLWRLPSVGISVGISSIAEFQIDGGFNQLTIAERQAGPLADRVTAIGDRSRDVQDLVVATKIRILSETYRRPAVGFRFATKLPNASNESGLGLDTTDVFMAVLLAKTTESVRVVGNLGVGILADPTVGDRQNDVLTYGMSLARALTDHTEIVGELNGLVSVREGDAFPGSETRGVLNFGGRYTTGSFRIDGGMFVGLTSFDPTFGITGGFTWVFRAFEVP